MKSTIQEYSNYTVISLNGQFVGGDETDKLFDLVNGVLQGSKKNLLLDFKHVIYFSSIVIGKLIKANRDFTDADAKFYLCNVNSTLKEVFKITKVASFVTIKDTLEEAIAEIA